MYILMTSLQSQDFPWAAAVGSANLTGPLLIHENAAPQRLCIHSVHCVSSVGKMDSDLDAIRQRRMAELMAKQGGGGQGMPMSQEDQEAQEEKMRAQEEQRRTMLAAIMTGEARERLARIGLVKPDKARAVENLLIDMARSGRLGEKVSEDRLVSLLEQINEKQGGSGPKITIQRRRPAFDDDD